VNPAIAILVEAMVVGRQWLREIKAAKNPIT
jgi:hypothetical protein